MNDQTKQTKQKWKAGTNHTQPKGLEKWKEHKERKEQTDKKGSLRAEVEPGDAVRPRRGARRARQAAHGSCARQARGGIALGTPWGILENAWEHLRYELLQNAFETL